MAGKLDGHYFSFRTGGNPHEVVDRFEVRQQGANRVTHYRNGDVGTKTRVHSATAKPMESFEIRGNALHGPVRGTVEPNGDIVWIHGYTSRREGSSGSIQTLYHQQGGGGGGGGKLDGSGKYSLDDDDGGDYDDYDD